MPETTTVQSRIAGLAGDNTQVISGVAVGAGDITRGLSGDKKVWQAEELRAAAESLEGTPVNPLHSEQTVGEVVRAGYEPGTGVIYEAELSDESLAEQAASGGLEVSIEARHADGGTVETDRGEAMAATNIRFTGLSLVQRGAAPSASAEPGEAAALSPAAIHESLANAALAEVNGTEVDLSPPGAVVNAAEAALAAKEEYDTLSDCGTGVGETRAEQIVSGDLSPEDFTSGGQAETAIPDYLNSHSEDVDGIDEPPTQWDEATWTDGCGPVQYALWGGTATGTGLEWAQSTADAVEAAMEDSEAAAVGPIEFDGTADGELDESELPNEPEEFEGHYLNAADTKSESSFPLVDADGNLRRGNLDAAWNLRGQGDLGMPRDAAERVMRSLGREFGEPGTEANPIPEDAYGGESADMAAGTDDSVSPEHGRDEGRQDSAQPHDTTTMGDDISDPEQRVNELKAELSDVREERDELAAQVEQYEQKEEAYEAAAEEFASALANSGETLFDEDELVNRFSVAELAGKVGDTESAALANAEPTVQSGGSEGGSETATLSDSEQTEVAEHREVIADLAGSDKIIAAKERERRAQQVAELTGEDPDTILEQEG